MFVLDLLGGFISDNQFWVSKLSFNIFSTASEYITFLILSSIQLQNNCLVAEIFSFWSLYFVQFLVSIAFKLNICAATLVCVWCVVCRVRINFGTAPIALHHHRHNYPLPYTATIDRDSPNNKNSFFSKFEMAFFELRTWVKKL